MIDKIAQNMISVLRHILMINSLQLSLTIAEPSIYSDSRDFFSIFLSILRIFNFLNPTMLPRAVEILEVVKT